MKLILCAAVATIALATTLTAVAQTAQPCDRACLLGVADAYFAALAAHDPSRAPMAPNAKFTEQTRELKVGEGLWKTTTEGPTAFKIPVPDPIINKDGTTRQQPMNFDPFDLEAAHIFKISGGKIHEIEAMGFTLPLYSKNGWSPFLR
jgi:hypothetical protein